MYSKLIKSFVLEALEGRIFDCAVHLLDLTIGPRVAWGSGSSECWGSVTMIALSSSDSDDDFGSCRSAWASALLYSSTDRLCSCGAAIGNLANSASFHSLENNAPSTPASSIKRERR